MGILRALNPLNTLRRFAKDRRGVSAVEFALIAPILITLYLGMAELTMGMMAARKASHLAASIGDLAAQSESLTNANMTDLFEIGDRIIAPFDGGSALRVRVTCVTMDKTDNKAKVIWSDPHVWTEKNTNDSPVVAAITTAQLPVGQSLIVTEVEYDYDSPLHSFLPAQTQFTDTFYHHPRNGSVVVRKTS
ncbi:pilus assembly protein [Asticcacaulis sp. SL142]|uniref:TadE/TadG family type IV pilus assembly protein n=1 Tax=Asticcacaulis sp. SL142 TaxID=2995155 RepID=UPI00226CCF82|nr:TadE/TadG family type IV pilus assembly protein [Asticcacaulis sp. SL142]WAC47702.1 pilus assembly protein [Asticcacaulis sp. SL142]